MDESVNNSTKLNERFRSSDSVEKASLQEQKFHFLYEDGDDYYFMHNETFEQISLPKENLSDIIDFLTENTSVDILFDGSIPLEVKIPLHMNLLVSSTEQGEKGNTATGATKSAELETGLIIQVPLFIKEGEKVRIDTKDKKYIERTKE